jgi:hypothetical protein
LITIRLPNGREVDIQTDDPTAAASAAARIFRAEHPAEFTAWRNEQPGPGLMAPFMRGIDELQGNLYSAAEGVGRITGLGGLERFGREGRERNEREARESMPDFQQQPFLDSEGAGDVVRAAGQAIATNAPNMGLSMGAMAAGAALGGVPGALLGGLVASYPQLFGANRQRQMQERPGQPVEEGAAALTAVPQAALDVVSDRILLGLGRALGRPSAEVGRTVLPRIARGIGVGAVTEIPTEVLQQSLERAQAGLDILSPEAMREYAETALASGASGGATGGAISGVAGARPAPTTAPTNTTIETPSGPNLQRVAEPLPEEPEPVATVEEARQILAANPTYAPPPGTSDEGLVVRANDVLRAVYRDQVSTIRQQTLADFTGARDIITQPGEVDAEGNIGDDIVDYSRAAQTLARNVLNAQGAGQLEDGRFTANQIADLALERLGLTHNALSRAERTALTTALNGMVAQGFLQRAGKSAYTLAPRPAAERGKPGTAPATAEEAAVPAVLNALSEFRANPTQANLKAAAAAAQNTQLASDVNEYLALSQAARVATVQANRLVTRNNPEEASTLQALQTNLQEIANQQAAIIDRLEGRARGTLVAPDSRTGQQPSPAGYVAGTQLENTLAGNADFSTQTGLPVPNIPPGMAETDAAVRAQQNTAAQAATQQAINLRDERQIAEAILNRPEEATQLVRDLAATATPGSRFDATNIQQAAAAQGIPLSPQTAVQLYNLARTSGVVNRLGMLPKAPTEPEAPLKEATPAQPVVEEQAQTATEETPADPHNDVAFMEPERSENDATFGDDRDAGEPNFATTRFRNRPETLPGLDIADDGSFDYTDEIATPDGAGVVNITGRIEDGALIVQTARATSRIRGQGYGIRAYQNLVDFAHSNGLDFKSDAMVSDAAGRVYQSLARRGYEVERLPGSDMYRSGDSWVAENANDAVYTIPAPYKFAEGKPGLAPRTELDKAVARQSAEESFRRVLGRNGRLEIQDQIFLRDLGEQFAKAAEEHGLPDPTGEVGGYALGDLAVLSLRDNEMPIDQIAIHEGYHVAENMGIIRPNEIKILNANLDKILAVIRKHLPYAPANLPPQEIRAYGQNARIAQKADFGSAINRIYDRFTNFVERVGNFVRGEGFQTWRDVYDAFNAGEMADRSPTNPRYTSDVNFVAGANSDSVTNFELAYSNRLHYSQSYTFAGDLASGGHILVRAFVPYDAPHILEIDSIAARDIENNPHKFDTTSTEGYRNGVKIGVSENKRLLKLVVDTVRKDWPVTKLRGFRVTGTHAKFGNYQTVVTPINFMASGIRVNGKPGDAAKVQRANVDQISGPLKWFGSPIMTMGKVKPELQAAADVQRSLYTRSNEMINATESLINDAHKLEPAQVARITRVWEAASRTRKKPNLEGLSQAEIRALQGEMQAVQRALDFFIESATIQNFMPTADKPAAVRARLEAFWAKHEGQHLWEIPQRELMSASPEGYREMQKFERLRNPYYMPMVGRGSHFVAAYKQKPNGERGELVALVAYTPNNFIQHMRGFADPQADAVAQLQREFGTGRYVIMKEGRQFTQDAQAKQLRDEGDFIASYMNRLREASGDNKAALKVISDMTHQIDKAQMERIFRPNRDILRAVTPANESSYILDVMPQYLLSMSKVQARRFTQAPYNEATKTLSPNDKAFLDELRNYATTPSEAFGNARAAAFFWYLGGALDTALINATQNFNTAAFLARDGGAAALPIMGRTMKELALATNAKQFLSDSTAFLTELKKRVNPAERDALNRAEEQGIFSPVFTNESRSQFTVDSLQKAGFKDARRAQKVLTKIGHIAGLPMQWVEEYNRSVAFLSAYRLATQDPSVITKANHADKTDFKDAYSYAVGKVIDTQYLTTKEDRSYIQRFMPAAEVMTQFMSYPLKTVEQYIRAGGQIVEGLRTSDPTLAKAGAVMLLGMAAPLIAIGGVWALPFAEPLREWAEKLTKLIWGSTQNFDADLREMLGAGRFAEAVVRGVPHAYGAMSLSHRVAVNPIPSGDMLDNAMTLFGPAGGIPQNASRAWQYYNNGDYWGMASALMPRALSNITRGAQLAVDQEQNTLRGNRIITPQDVQRVDAGSVVPSSVRQALGFPPPEFVNTREAVYRAEEINRANRTQSERYNRELSGYLTSMMDANRVGDAERAARESVRFGERLREILEKQDGRPPHLRYAPNMSSLTRQAMMDFYGIGSQQALARTGRTAARPEIERQRQMLDWRNQPN